MFFSANERSKGEGKGKEEEVKGRERRKGTEKGKGKLEVKLWQKRKKSQTPQPGIEPGTPANAADALPLSHRDKRYHQPVLPGGRTDNISNKLAGDIACLGGSTVEHQPRLLGFRVRFPAGAFAIFSVSAKASLPISLSLSPFPFSFPSSSFHFLFLSLSFSLRPFVCAKKRIFAFIP